MAYNNEYVQFPDTTIDGRLLQRWKTPEGKRMLTIPGKVGTDDGQPLYITTDGVNYDLTTWNPEGGHRPANVTNVDNTGIKKLIADLFPRAFGEKTEQKKLGGNMNYTSYLAGGGAAPQNAAPQVSKEDIAEIITAALNGTGEAKQKATAALQEMMQDASLAPLVEQVMDEMGIPSQKCGGRVKKKEMGSKLVKAEKAKCGCALKKVGGRLIEVDTCTGLPIHRNGGSVRKYQNSAGGGITFKDGAFYNNGLKMSQQLGKNDAQANWGVTYNDGNYYYLNNGTMYTQAGSGIGNRANSYGWKAMDWNKLDPTVAASMGLIAGVNNNNKSFYQKGTDGLYTKYANNNTTPNYRYGLAKNGVFYQDFGASDAQWDPTKGTWTREGYNYDPSKGWVSVEPEQSVVENPKPDPVKTWRDTFGAGKSGKFGGLTYDQALAFQQEMLNADWFNANLGTSGATKRGDDGMWGQTSQREWARYQSELQARKAQAAAAEAEKQQLNDLQASSVRRTTSNGMTNEELLAMDENTAVFTLSRPDYERWVKLNKYQRGLDAALTYNGKRYNDEAAYNAAVNDEIMRTAPQFNVQAALNTRGRRKRNAMFSDYQTARDKHVANNTYLYKGPAALTQEQLSATSFKTGGKFNYKNYLQS